MSLISACKASSLSCHCDNCDFSISRNLKQHKNFANGTKNKFIKYRHCKDHFKNSPFKWGRRNSLNGAIQGAILWMKNSIKLIAFFSFARTTCLGINSATRNLTCKKYYGYTWFSFSYSLHLLVCRLTYFAVLPKTFVSTMLESLYVSNLLSILYKRQPHKMVKHTQTIRRLTADEFFEYVWPFCGIGAERVKINLWNENYSIYFVQMCEVALPRNYCPSNNGKTFFTFHFSAAQW